MPTVLDIPAKAYRGLRLMMLVNGVQKLVIFLLNSSLLRRTSPDIMGVANVQLELFLSTLLFFAREGVRLALLREVVDSPEKRQLFVNLSWLPAIVLFVGAIGFLAYAYCADHFSNSLEHHSSQATMFVMLLYCIGALFESCGEAWINLYQNSLHFTPKLGAETLALCVRSVVVFVSLVHFKIGVLGFGFGQLGYGLTHLLFVISHSGSIFDETETSLAVRDYCPRLSGECRWVSGSTLSFAFSATASSLLKHVLTEADKITLTLTRTNVEQGVFAIANNYAGLVARLAFAPVEESARAAFARFSQTLTQLEADKKKASGREKDEEKKVVLRDMAQLLARLLKAVAALGLVVVAFGPSFVSLAVNLFLAPQWRREETVQTLAAFCLYIGMLALNGVSEAFVYALAEGFTGINLTLGVSSAVYVVANYLLYEFYPQVGTAGVVLSGTAAYAVRVAINFHATWRYFQSHGLDLAPHAKSLQPSLPMLATLGAVGAICAESSSRYAAQETLESGLVHLAIGAVSFVFVVVVAYLLTPKEELAVMGALVTRKKEKED